MAYDLGHSADWSKAVYDHVAPRCLQDPLEDSRPKVLPQASAFFSSAGGRKSLAVIKPWTL